MLYKQKSFLILKVSSGIILSFIILLIGFGVYGTYDALHPPRIVPPGNTLREEGIPFQAIDLITQDGIRLSAWYTPPQKGTVILLAHGYGDNRPEWIYAMLAKKGYGVLAWDARAHGESSGEISTISYLETLDVKAAVDYAMTQPDVEDIGAWGGSMGGATMIRAAAEFPQIEALVVDSSFASLNDEIDFLAPYPLVNPMAKFFMGLSLNVDMEEISPVALIGMISPRPVYIIQGTGDVVAPPESAIELYEAAHEPRYLWTEEDVVHLGMYLDNPSKYKRRVVGFFDQNLLGK
jgi:uncharacterized protein